MADVNHRRLRPSGDNGNRCISCYKSVNKRQERLKCNRCELVEHRICNQGKYYILYHYTPVFTPFTVHDVRLQTLSKPWLCDVI